MITLNKTLSGNTITATFSERLAEYSIPLSTGATFYLKMINDSTKVETVITLTDTSSVPFRYNHFEVNEDLSTYPSGQYSYTAYADSGLTQSLEVGRLLISGAASDNIYS